MRAALLIAAACAASVASWVGVAHADHVRSFAGSVQLDYLAVPSDSPPRQSTLDGSTVELSLRLAVDISSASSAHVKVCFACHGFEAGMAFVDLRASDELRLRVGRMIPELGAFPVRHDPANHDTSDKPLPYDMGRMLRLREWNEGVLPAPWVDNGLEILGTHFLAGGRIDYAAYLIGGPKGAADATDFDFIASRSPSSYYIDNNSQPVAGARLWGTLDLAGATATLGISGMGGHYDDANRLRFAIAGADVSLETDSLILRAEYLARWTQMALGPDPLTRFKYAAARNGRFADYFYKDGFYVEAEAPLGKVALIARWDGLRRAGNVLATSRLRSRSALLRYTAALAYTMPKGIKVKTSIEYYDFSDFCDATAIHIGLATAF
jgi:hypothetical protein